jgi:hypothetical protein
LYQLEDALKEGSFMAYLRDAAQEYGVVDEISTVTVSLWSSTTATVNEMVEEASPLLSVGAIVGMSAAMILMLVTIMVKVWQSKK